MISRIDQWLLNRARQAGLMMHEKYWDDNLTLALIAFFLSGIFFWLFLRNSSVKTYFISSFGSYPFLLGIILLCLLLLRLLRPYRSFCLRTDYFAIVEKMERLFKVSFVRKFTLSITFIAVVMSLLISYWRYSEFIYLAASLICLLLTLYLVCCTPLVYVEIKELPLSLTQD